jgi:subtilase family serine protease
VASDLPGDRDDLVCFTVQNRGVKSSAPFRVTIGIEGATPLVPDIGAAGLGAGETREQCTGGRLPDSGLHRLSVVVDGADTVPEMDERNNDLAVGLDRTPAGQTRAPGGPGVATTDTGDSTQSGGGPTIAGPATAPTGSTIGIRSTQPDLTVDAVRVNGQVPDGKSDCKDGKNTVSVVVKNAGMARAGSFTVRLEVDGGQAIEMDVPGLEATQEHEARFDDVRLKKGEHRLTVTVDSKNTVAEANEDNNVRTVTATCQNAG